MAEQDSVNAAHALFDLFVQAQRCKDVKQHFAELCKQLAIDPKDFRNFYSKLKERLNYWKAKSLWVKLDKRGSHSEYQQRKACIKNKVVVIPGARRDDVIVCVCGRTRVCVTRPGFYPFLPLRWRLLGLCSHAPPRAALE